MQQNAPLPSAETAYRLVRGDGGALPLVFRDLFFRALLIGAGVKLAGASWRKTGRYAIAGSLAIETFVLTYAAIHANDAPR